MIRNGPKPLQVHLSMAMNAVMQNMQSQDMQSREGEDSRMIEGMLAGIKKYQNAKLSDLDQQFETIWQKGSVSLRSFKGNKHKKSQLVLLIPSLINGSEIFHLSSDQSFVDFLSRKGFHPVILDWGDLQADPAQDSLSMLIQDRMTPALFFLQKEYQQPLHALGYCMGGTLLAAVQKCAMERKDNNGVIHSMIFLATPWDFHIGRLKQAVEFWLPQAMTVIENKGYLPVDWIQTVFASLDPFKTAQKFVRFNDFSASEKEHDVFIRTEDWLNNGCGLPANIARECIFDWFLKNKIIRGDWCCGDVKVDAAFGNIPSLVVASKKDSIVEYASAVEIAKEGCNTTVLSPDCGHIGMMAGSQSKEQVWRPIVEWITSHNL